MAMLALTAGQAFAQRCLPQMKGIEVKVGMADGVYNGKKSCKAGYYAGLGLSSYTKGGDKWTYGAEYLQVHQPYRDTSVPIAQMTGEFGYSYNFLSDNSKTVLFYVGGSALAGYESVNWGKRTSRTARPCRTRERLSMVVPWHWKRKYTCRIWLL